MEEKNSLLTRYKKIRDTTENICNPLVKEDYVVQPNTDVSPPKWHLGHTTWFFELFLLKKFRHQYSEYNSKFNYIFNSYYESAGERILRSNRGNLSRPSTDEIYDYRRHVDTAVMEWLSNDPPTEEEIHKLFEIGLNHEQQHQELLLTDIKYILGHNPLFPVYQNRQRNLNNPKSTEEKYIEIEEGIYEIGHDSYEFSYDNETPLHKILLPSFRIMTRLITNGEYLEFMKAGGYTNHDHWLSDGWNWINENEIDKPLYWHIIKGKWHFYTLHGLKEIDLHAPVCHLSYYEADAFASWKGKRLPTETEWEVAFQKLNSGNNIYNLFSGSINEPLPGINGSTQILGDVWEWTSSAYLPYPGYQLPEGAIGEYNGKFMINQMVLRGGSCATPKNHIRKTYRNFFQTNKRWQFTGIRLAEDKK